MGAILDNAKIVYVDGPSTSPTNPDKVAVISLFGLIDDTLTTLVDGMVIGGAVVYSTRAALYADLAHGAGTLGVVYNDSTPAYNGVYVKSGASGSGSWAITNLALPSTFAADLAAVTAEVTGARGGEASLDARLDDIETEVATKADQSALNTTNATIAALDTALDAAIADIADKADQADLDAADAALAAEAAKIIKLQAATGAPIITPGYPIEWDRNGILGMALTMYVPRNLFASVGSTSFNSDFGTATTPRPNHYAITLANVSDAQMIYVDLDDATTPIKSVQYPTVPDKTRPDKVFLLAIVRRLQVVWSVTPVIENKRADIVALGYLTEWDRHGVIGPAGTIYVARNLFVSRGTVQSDVTLGTASTARPNHVALTLTDPSSTAVHVAYLDLNDATNPQKLAEWPNVALNDHDGSIVIVAIIRRLQVVWSQGDIINHTDPSKTRIAPQYPIVSEKDVVLIPSYYAITSTGATLHAPADGSRYWEISRNASSVNDRRILHDSVVAAAGGVPVRYVDSTGAPRVPSDYLVAEIASVMRLEMKTPFASVGYVEGGLVPNQFPLGKTPDLAQRYTQESTTVVDVTDADLIALGFTRGVSGISAVYGGSAPADTPMQGYVFGRLYVQAVTDDTWGEPTLYIRNKSDVLSSVPMALEKRINSKAAIFSFFTQYDYSATGKRPNHIWLGITGNTTGIIVTGAQFYLGSGARGWIARDDWPMDRRGDVLYPEKHYVIGGRELPFVPASIVADRDDPAGRELIAVSTNGDGVPMLEASSKSLKLDYSMVVDGSTIMLTAPGGGLDRGRRFTRSVDVVRKATPIPGSPKILAVGDSITLRGTVPAMNAKLAAMGLTPTWMGTLKMQLDDGTYSTLYAEGRSGWAFGDLVYASTALSPVAAGDEAVYVARSAEGFYGTTRHGVNPFIRLATGGDDGDIIKNGYVFDLRFFADRFEGLIAGFDGVDPDYVIIGDATNDINELDIATAFTRVTEGWTITINQARVAFPSAKIGVWIPAPPYGILSQQRWQSLHVPLLKWLLAYIESLADADIEAIGVWGHMTPSASYSLAMTTTAGGLTEGWVVDELHPSPASTGDNYNRQAIAEVLAQWIACREA